MKRILYVSFLILLSLSSCKKDDKADLSGTATIDNTTYQSTTYYVFGFSFSLAKKVSTLDDPHPDIVLYVDIQPTRLTLQHDNLRPSFYKAGEYADEASARTAFDNLKTVSVSQWIDMADPVLDNQIWVYRVGNDTYAKIRIVNTKSETRDDRPYGECTFQWVYQPDGSLTFPGK